MPKVGDLVADKYEIEKIIGEGGMGAVFAATHKLTGKRVAMKWMLPELARDEDAVQRFMREAQAAGRINHPNVVDVYDVGKHDDSFFIVMEHLTGEPLTVALERRDLNVGQMLDLILPAMRGVAAAHRQGVVHRDLKPDNIFLALEEGQRSVPKVLDFGISKVASSEGQVNPRLTRTGAVVGTPYYMCPEAIRGSTSVDKRADVYAFGVILYEAVSGIVPFNADTYSALILEIVTGTAKPLHDLVPSIPEALGEIVMQAMAREVEQRFQDLESLGAALEPYAETVMMRVERRDPTGAQKQPSVVKIVAAPTGTVTTPFVSEAPTVPREKGGMRVVMAIAAVAVLGLAAWLLTRDDAAPSADAHVVTPAGSPINGAAEPAVAQPTAAAQPAPEAAQVPAVLPVAATPDTAAVGAAAAQPGAAEATSAGATGAASAAARDAADKLRRRAAAHRDRPAAAATHPTPNAERGTGRARSGTLSVDDF